MHKKIYYLKYAIILILSLLLFTGLKVFADTGPKPSLHITINDFPGEEVYVTVLSSEAYYGPNQWITDENIDEYNLSEIEYKFFEYCKTQDYFFWGNVKKLDKKNNTFSWTYYPPYKFKVICYIESIDQFIISNEPLERYAFNTYYKMDIVNDSGAYQITNIKKNYNYFMEIFHFLLRVIITLVIELVIAYFLFKFRKQTFVIIIVTNVITQLGLNIILNLMSMTNHGISLYIYYFFLELLVVFIEASVYLLTFRRYLDEYKIGKIILYALLSNALSFIYGLIIMMFVPGLL